jgi:hypothetical protein
MSVQRAGSFTACLLAFGLASCGLAVPDIKEAWDADLSADATGTPPISATTIIEFEIRKRIYCELKEAVMAVDSVRSNSDHATNPLIPPDWIAQASLSLQVDESSALNPGISLNDVWHNAIKSFGPGNTVTIAQGFGLSFGGTLSSVATRIDKFDPSWSVASLLRPASPYSVCSPQNDPFVRVGLTPPASSPFLLESDLRIKEWLFGAIFNEKMLPSTASKGATGGGALLAPQAVSLEIKFIIVTSGNITPTWK